MKNTLREGADWYQVSQNKNKIKQKTRGRDFFAPQLGEVFGSGFGWISRHTASLPCILGTYTSGVQKWDSPQAPGQRALPQ